MRIVGVENTARINPYAGKPRVRPAVDEYSQHEKAAETFSFVNILDNEVARLSKEKRVYSDISDKKKNRKVPKI